MVSRLYLRFYQLRWLFSRFRVKCFGLTRVFFSQDSLYAEGPAIPTHKQVMHLPCPAPLPHFFSLSFPLSPSNILSNLLPEFLSFSPLLSVCFPFLLPLLVPVLWSCPLFISYSFPFIPFPRLFLDFSSPLFHCFS